MNDNPIRKSLEKIEPLPGAEQRMYANITEKASAPRKKSARKTAVRILVPAAACLAVVLSLALFRKEAEPSVRPSDSVCIGSPITPVESPEDLAPAGVIPVLPEDAEIDACYLIRGGVAKMEFTRNGIPYICLASVSQDDDFSGVYGEYETIRESDGSRLSRVDDSIWVEELHQDGITAYFLNMEGAEEADMVFLAENFSVKIP